MRITKYLVLFKGAKYGAIFTFTERNILLQVSTTARTFASGEITQVKMGINSDNAKAVLAKIGGGTNILSIPKVGT